MNNLEVRVGDRTVMVTLTAAAARIGDEDLRITAIGPGCYRVTDGSRQWTIAVAGPPEDRWLFVDGQVERVEVAPGRATGRGGRARERPRGDDFAAPMPATVARVLVAPGSPVVRGETLVILEAMKMELPIRAPRDGVVRAVHCSAGELVQPGVPLLDFE